MRLRWRPAFQAGCCKDRIQIESGAESIGKHIQLLPAVFTPRRKLDGTRHLKRRARCPKECVTEPIAIEETVQISAEDAAVVRDASIGQDVRSISLAGDVCERLCLAKIFRCAQVNLITGDFALTDRLAKQRFAVDYSVCRNGDLIVFHDGSHW